ncbi:MAG: patatin-like phospholipase family protein [Bacteriovorax sp.]
MKINTENVFVPALVLNGAGARTAYQVGALKALGEIFPQEKSPFGIICGTSAGSINGAYISSHAEDWKTATESLAQIWSQLYLDQIFETSGYSLSRISSAWISRILLGDLHKRHRESNHMLDTKPLGKLLTEKIDFPAIHQHIHKKNLQAVSFTSIEYFEQTTVTFFDAHPDLLEWTHTGRKGVRCELDKKHVLASTAIPVFFPPVKIGGSYFGDGCLRQSSPLSPAIHLGADRILSIGIRQKKKETKHVSEHIKRQPPAFAEILGELFNALFLDSLDPDIERLERINEAIRNASSGMSDSRFGLREIPNLHLAPSCNLGDLIPDIINNLPVVFRYFIKGLGASDFNSQGKELISYLAFTKECVNPLLSLGFEDTMKRKAEILKFMKS